MPAAARPAGLILRERSPDNLEYPFSTLDVTCPAGRITPNPSFYVRTHFPIPQLDAAWRLRVEGAVDHPLTLSLDELKSLPAVTYTALLECAGNSRIYLSPTATGVQWEQGAVGCARWTGVRLADVLARAGLRDTAVEIILEGADSGVPSKSPKPRTPIRFARSLPLAQARVSHVLLAYTMNDEALPPVHGAPLRAIVPGWYAMASTKWLSRIVVADKPFQGYFQTVDYARWTHDEHLPERVPLTELAVKSQIARPALREQLPAGKPYCIVGAAWSAAEITQVEISTDAGQTWQPATLLDPPLDHAWQRWEFQWTPPAPGEYTLMSRATDARGRTQPSKSDVAHTEGYVIHHTVPICVTAV